MLHNSHKKIEKIKKEIKISFLTQLHTNELVK